MPPERTTLNFMKSSKTSNRGAKTRRKSCTALTAATIIQKPRQVSTVSKQTSPVSLTESPLMVSELYVSPTGERRLCSPEQRQFLLRNLKHGPKLPREELPEFLKYLVTEHCGLDFSLLAQKLATLRSTQLHAGLSCKHQMATGNSKLFSKTKVQR